MPVKISDYWGTAVSVPWRRNPSESRAGGGGGSSFVS